ncbi:hypothetical protein NUM3379_12350 [Kineococcus sp. NUM-3379]
MPSSRLGEAETAALRDVAAATGARLLLVRRPDAVQRRGTGGRTLFRVTCGREGAAVLTRTVDAPGTAAAAAAEDGWAPHPGRLLLVCTHGRKDWCCAVRGRPVAAALAALDPAATWECSHLGGDRFAATVLDLPTGTMHGRLTPADVPALHAALVAGRVLPHLLRGRCADAMVVQAAEVHARLRLGLDGLEDLRPLAARRGGDGATWDVRFRAGRRPVRVLLRAGSSERAQKLTCAAPSEQHPRDWHLLDVEVGEPAAP